MTQKYNFQSDREGEIHIKNSPWEWYGYFLEQQNLLIADCYLHYHAIPKNIFTPHTKSIRISWGRGEGSVRQNSKTKKKEVQLEFP